MGKIVSNKPNLLFIDLNFILIFDMKLDYLDFFFFQTEGNVIKVIWKEFRIKKSNKL